MRALLQRVDRAGVRVEGREVASIGNGLLILLGVGHDDTEAVATALAKRITELRIFADEGYQFGLNNGVPPIPRDRMVTFASLPRPHARTLREEIEGAGIPVLLFRSPQDPIDMDDDARRWDLLLPASAEKAAKERFGRRRDALARSATPPA